MWEIEGMLKLTETVDILLSGREALGCQYIGGQHAQGLIDIYISSLILITMAYAHSK